MDDSLLLIRPDKRDMLHSYSGLLIGEYSKALATFGRVHVSQPNQIIDCHSIEDVRAAVIRADLAGLRVRVMGNGYSWSPYVLTRDVCLRLVGLSQIKEVDKVSKRVRVQAGARLGDLTRALAAHGLCLPSLSFVSDATIGGVIATGTHGTSPKWGTLSDFVRSIMLVLPTGEIKTLGPSSSAEELRAAKVAVGMLGVIVEVELQAIEMPWVRYSKSTMDLSGFMDQRENLLAKYDHIWVHWVLGRNKVSVQGFEVRATPATGFQPYVTGENAVWQNRRLLFRGGRFIQRSLRRAAAPLTALVQRKAGSQPVYMSMQYGLPASQAETAIRSLYSSDFAKIHAGREVELKFLKGTNDNYLGSNSGEDSILFNLYWNVADSEKFTIFDSFETIMRSFSAKPHWGKAHSPLSVDYIKKAFPRWAEFEAVRSKFDAKGTFSIFPKFESL